jgi:hypothetical protein
MHIGEPLITAAVAEGETLVVDAHLMEQRGMDVVDAHGIAGDGVAEVVGLAKGHAAFEAATDHENAVAIYMMVTACGATDLRRVRCAAHLTSPQHDGFIEQASLIEIDDERGNALIGDAGVFLVVLLQLTMLIPG